MPRPPSPASLANLKPAKKGEVRNKAGVNGAKKLKEWETFALEESGLKDKAGQPVQGTRDDLVLMTTFLIACDKNHRFVMAAQEHWYARTRGAVKQKMDLSNEDGSLVERQPQSSEEMIREVQAMQAAFAKLSDSTVKDAASTPDPSR